LRKALALCACLLALPAQAAEQPAGFACEGRVEALFSPWDDIEGQLIDTLAAAQRSIYVQAYLLTSRNIAKALLRAHQRGVAVQILTDDEMTVGSDSTRIPELAAAGIPVWLETRYANAHNKVMLIDVEGPDPVLITGSYNYTWSAQARNAENVLILRGNRALADAYLRNWQRHRRDADSYSETPTNGK
jgi:phosphatidylserine/phosphatidylglycerophosphate/cardiolipin synthase-like enzyme